MNPDTSARPRVLFVTPYPPKKDGLATYASDLAAVLAESAEVSVAAQSTAAADNAASVPVYPVLSAGPATALRLVRLVRRTRADVVHVQFTVPAWGVQVVWLLVAVAWVRRTRPVTVVWTLHEVVREVTLLRGAGRRLYRTISRLSDVLVVLSDSSADCLVDVCSVAPEHIMITPHGVPRRTAGPDRDRSAGPVVFFGYIHPDKGVEHLMAATSRLGQMTRPELVVAGAVRPRRGVFRLFERRDHRYERRLRALAPSRTRFVGYLDDTDLDELLCAARVVVFPYNAVTQSGAVNRALALGCPVVASDLPGLRDDVPHSAGLVTPADEVALAATLAAVVDDPVLQQEMSAAARQMAVDRSTARAADALRERYVALAGRLAPGIAP